MQELSYYKRCSVISGVIVALVMILFCYGIVYRGYTNNMAVVVLLALAVAIPAGLSIQFFEEYQIFKESFQNFYKVKIMEKNCEIISIDVISKTKGLKCGIVYYRSPVGSKQRILVNCTKIIINQKEDSTLTLKVEKGGELVLTVPVLYVI